MHVLGDVSPARDPFALRGIAARGGPFLAAIVVSQALVVLQPHRDFAVGVLIAAAASGLIAASVVVLPWGKLPSFLQAVPPLAYLGVVPLLTEGNEASPFAALALLPVVWLALHGTVGQLNAALLAVACLFLAPGMMATGEQAATDLRAGVLWTALAVGLGYAIQHLVRALRTRTEALEAAALTDYITGLPNRRAWEERLPRFLATERRSELPVSVAFVDLDGFKEFNDLFGHQAGDALLRDCGVRWVSQLRSTDFVARHGGDEFAVVLPGCGLDDAHKLMERLKAVIPQGLTASVGVVCWSGEETPDQLMRRADVALYEAKRSGRDRVVAAA
jgi:diguanylate cyclase (GGDEF)-like protein